MILTKDVKVSTSFANSVSFLLFLVLGWEGAGLGRSQQGIYDPISGGEVRDKFDKFKVRDSTRQSINQPVSQLVSQDSQSVGRSVGQFGVHLLIFSFKF